MTNEHEQRIRELAHHIWESEGRPQGEDARHWQMAERLVEASESAKAARGKPRAAPKVSTRATAKRAGTASTSPAPPRRRAPKGSTP